MCILLDSCLLSVGRMCGLFLISWMCMLCVDISVLKWYVVSCWIVWCSVVVSLMFVVFVLIMLM